MLRDTKGRLMKGCRVPREWRSPPLDMDNITKQILYGSIMGDACIVKKKYETGTGTRYSYAFSELHCIEQEGYLLWKNRFLKFIFHKEYNKKRKRFFCRINKTSEDLKKYYDMFYPNGKKQVSKAVLDGVGALGLCVFYLDDGTYSYRNANTSLCISKLNKTIVKKWLKKKFGLNTKYCKNKLAFTSESRDVFINMIKDVVPECMRYKVGEDSERERKAKLKIKEYRERPYVQEKAKKYRQSPRGKESQRKYRLKNKEKLREKGRTHYWKNREKILTRNHRPEIKKRKRERQKEYLQIPKVKERVKECKRQWYIKNKERLKGYLKEYRRRPEVKRRRKKYQQKYRMKNREKTNILAREYKYQKKIVNE